MLLCRIWQGIKKTEPLLWGQKDEVRSKEKEYTEWVLGRKKEVGTDISKIKGPNDRNNGSVVKNIG